VITEQVTVDAEAFNKAAAALNDAGFEEIAAFHVKHCLRQSANVVRDNVKKRAARHNRGRNRLVKGIHTTWKGAGFQFQLRVMASGPVAHLIIGGTRPHEIRALRKPLIVPPAARGFAESVHVHGIRPDPIVRDGTRDSLPAIQALVDAAGKAMLDELAGTIEESRR